MILGTSPSVNGMLLLKRAFKYVLDVNRAASAKVSFKVTRDHARFETYNQRKRSPSG